MSSNTEAVETVTETWLRSFQAGLALGLTGKPLPIKKEPVAYLYNGVRLPKLPELDRETYPYAYIHKLGTAYQLFVFSQAAHYDPSYTEYLMFDDGVTGSYLLYECADNSASWEFILDDTDVACLVYTSVFWTNTDVLDTSGGVYLAASEPVPVYE